MKLKASDHFLSQPKLMSFDVLLSDVSDAVLENMIDSTQFLAVLFCMLP